MNMTNSSISNFLKNCSKCNSSESCTYAKYSKLSEEERLKALKALSVSERIDLIKQRKYCNTIHEDHTNIELYDIHKNYLNLY